MSVEVGQKVTGKVVNIRNFGAFVNLENNQTGLIHISEVSNGFVKDINDYLSEGDEVEVRVIKITDDGKINLSLRPEKEERQSSRPAPSSRPARSKPRRSRGQSRKSSSNDNFDQLMNQFLRESEDRLSSLRRNTEGKRGGRGGRRN